ncbi:hypothetical protein GUITHDRAFT_156833 [Guillardia theta CCMP2712]|uniref:DNA topoisomerase n=1 Tax=Guillardia theta (strain CCMP2712) TaxID=905079 RepID=L1K3I3_GUITC|nr:hypothetical protein GUITHDRAFT_156833 [Guillardia theta CCMP2712]EKX55025.1 hypothetical protein GUITHDRAFT_156833 [Guillardia theta CCMP2712]|eukprot:XP_005842005.1 hypothetical protein GUITHDRAFT_156833 [Guillardia theta CCMP2712]
MSADRVLCVAEKPSVAKELAAILSQGHAQAFNTHSQYNRKFEFSYELDGRPCTLVVTSVTGHLMERDFDESHRKWHTCEPIQLLDPSIQVIKMIPQDKKGLERNLLEEGRRCGQLVCFLDCDREGENISYEVIEICQKANPRIRVRRAHFSALIPRDIHRAMRTLTLPNQSLSEAVEARSEIDLRLGAAFTRFQTMVLGKRFEQLSDKLLSWGPCQFATLGFIVDRAWKIERFVPEDFWSFRCNLSRDGKTAHFDWRRGRLFDRVACTLIYEMLMEDPIATVNSVHERLKERWRPLPLSTVNLQTIASRKLRMSSEETMQIAEELYNKGFISYPRTETEKFKEGTNLQELISKQCESGHWGNYANELLAGSFQWPRAGQNDDQAHPPIHPTQFTNSLSGKQAQLYELVVRHFLACCSKNAIGAETTVEISIGVEQFVSKGLMIKELNWLKVYPYERWSDKDIPIFTEGEQFEPTELAMTEGRTQAPPLLSEADLISLMDSHGIGTDATIAEHITKVQQRDYAIKSDSQQFSPTSLGKSLVTSYEAIGLELARPHFRARMEQDMTKIASGQTSARVVIEEWMEIMKPIFQRCIAGQTQMAQEMSVFFQPLNASSWSQTLQRNVSQCGVCSGLMDLKKQRNGETRALFVKAVLL